MVTRPDKREAAKGLFEAAMGTVFGINKRACPSALDIPFGAGDARACGTARLGML
jgi:hypothetical protein